MAENRSGGTSGQNQATVSFLSDSPRRAPRVDLNTASRGELMKLPGVGAELAELIIKERKRLKFVHPEELTLRGIVDATLFAALRGSIGATVNLKPQIQEIRTDPAPLISGRKFRLVIDFINSQADVGLVLLQVEAVGHSIRRVRKAKKDELERGEILEPMPPMTMGPLEVRAILYDNSGRSDQLVRSFTIFPSNPVQVMFFPSGRTLRLSNGAASFSDAGNNFSDNANFTILNGDNQTVTLSGVIEDRTVDQNGNLLDSGSFDIGPIVVGPFGTSGGWYNITYPNGNAVYNKLKNKEEVRTTYTLRFQNDDSRTLTSQVTWRSLLGPRINIIRVGEENFTDAQRQKIVDGIGFVRSIYEQVDFTIGDPVDFWIITVAQAEDDITIDDNGAAKDLTEDWTVPNDKIDVFISLNIKGASGWSPVNGPCDKNASGMTGSVVDIGGDVPYFGNSLAHEMGHYMGLDHVADPNNFIGNNGDSDSKTGITVDQYNTMKQHCFVRFLP